MPLNPQMMNTAARIIGDIPTRLGQQRDVIGTGFLVSIPSESIPDLRYPYVVTADHVIANQTDPEIEVPNPFASGELYPPIQITDWRQPLSKVDLAIAPFPRPDDATYVSLAAQFLLLPADVHPPLASPVYYIGILTPLDRPMVRSGTLGALYQEGIPHEGGYIHPAHLVDCRSYGGFSGSPCFVEFAFPVLREEELRLPLPPQDRKLDRPRGVLDHISLLCGMFTAHLSDQRGSVVSRYGVGVMLPSSEIWRAFMTDEMQEERRRWDEEQRSEDETSEP